MTIDEMPAGREMDALVYECVFGREKRWRFVNGEPCQLYGEHGFGAIGYQPYGIPLYSTNIAAAWEVVERMRSTNGLTLTQGRGATIAKFSPYGYPIVDGPEGIAGRRSSLKEQVKNGNTAPLAICRAALRAVGVTEVP
jgi:hypothetical protein